MIKCVIIDPNEMDRDILKKYLQQHKQIGEIEEADDFFSGVKLINRLTPDLVFCEIDLRRNSGFKIADCFEEDVFEIIYMSHQSQAALKAFRHAALGYLVKPIKEEMLLKYLEKIFAFRKTPTPEKIEPSDNRLILPAPGGYHYLPSEEIVYLIADRKTTFLYKIDGDVLSIPTSLKECLSLLQAKGLIRIHRSIIINSQHIQQYVKGYDPHVIMEGGKKLDVGPQFKEELDKLLALVIK